MQSIKAIWLGAGLALLAGLAPVSMAAEQGDAPAAQPAPDAAPADVSDAKLEKFADAYVAVAQVRSEYSGKLDGADKQQKRKLQRKARKDMTEAVETNGMSVEEYNRIGGAIQQDKALKKRAVKMIRERQAQ